MKVTISIECDTVGDLVDHLGEISRQVKKRSKKTNLDPLHDEFTRKDAYHLYDDNCYGTHSVKIS